MLSWCKSCFNSYHKARAYPSKAARKRQEYHLKSRYGMTVEAYESLLERQVCAICRSPSKTYKLCVDHEHVTGRIRGILCAPCNRALGVLGDSEQGLQRVMDYLRVKEGSNG